MEESKLNNNCEWYTEWLCEGCTCDNKLKCSNYTPKQKENEITANNQVLQLSLFDD